ITLANNPFECGLDRFFTLGKPAEYMSREALDRIAGEGAEKKLIHLMIDGERIAPPRSSYPVFDQSNRKVGILTSMAWSPRFSANLAFAMVDVAAAVEGQSLSVEVDGQTCHGQVCNMKWSRV
ncbi:MAG: hypothetical protein HKN85_00905, partial [Gammaproteobacteria bacterium]|nr:hypothetical protein [Gammaproteobacteria bacterium]